MPAAPQGRARSTRRWALGVVSLALTAAIGTAVLRDTHPRSAQFGPEGVRTFEAAPDDLPPGILPDGAVEVAGTVARSSDGYSAAVSFVLDGGRDEVKAHVDPILADSGWIQRQRAYDEVTMQLVYDRTDGAVLTVTYESIEGGTGTAIVLAGRAA